MVNLTSKEWFDRWATFRQHEPEYGKATRESLITQHQQSAELAESERQWADAVSHLDFLVDAEPKAWTDEDVRQVLEGMLSTMHRLKHPEESTHAVALRGLSWIVNPFEDGGVVIAVEVGMGAAVAGPFDADQAALETMITRVIASPPRAPQPSGMIH